MSRKHRASEIATGRALRDLAKEKVLPPSSPEAKRRDELLAIMNDPRRSVGARLDAAIAATPLCYEELPPVPYAPSNDN